METYWVARNKTSQIRSSKQESRGWPSSVPNHGKDVFPMSPKHRQLQPCCFVLTIRLPSTSTCPWQRVHSIIIERTCQVQLPQRLNSLPEVQGQHTLGQPMSARHCSESPLFTKESVGCSNTWRACQHHYELPRYSTKNQADRAKTAAESEISPKVWHSSSIQAIMRALCSQSTLHFTIGSVHTSQAFLLLQQSEETCCSAGWYQEHDWAQCWNQTVL